MQQLQTSLLSVAKILVSRGDRSRVAAVPMKKIGSSSYSYYRTPTHNSHLLIPPSTTPILFAPRPRTFLKPQSASYIFSSWVAVAQNEMKLRLWGKATDLVQRTSIAPQKLFGMRPMTIDPPRHRNPTQMCI
jgi:hypothetical protein